MAQQHDIDQAWLGLLDAERMSRYYQAMAARLQRWHMGLTAFVALGATGAVGSLLSGAPDWVAELLAVGVAAAAVWSFYYGHASKAAMMEAAGNNCADLALRWRNLWARLDALDGEEALREIQGLQRREQAATENVPAHLASRHRLNVKCAEETYAVLGAEYAVAG